MAITPLTEQVPSQAPQRSWGGRLAAGGFRQRLLLSLLAVVLLTAALVGGLAYWRFQESLNRALQEDIQAYTAAVARAVVVADGTVSLEPDRLSNLPEWGRTRFRVVRGEQVYSEIGGRFPDQLAGWVTATRPLGQGFQLEAALDTQDRSEALRAFLQTELLALPLSLGLALVAAYLLFGYLMRPIRRLTEATHLLAQQRFPEPLPVPPAGDELSDLAGSFNRMTEAVRGFLERERSFSRYTSHELRTPLATLRAQIEALELGLLPQEEAIPTVKASLSRLERLLAGLIALTRSPQSDPAPVQIGEVLATVIEGLPAATRSRVEVTGDLGATVRGYEEPLQQALNNLLGNALKFSQGRVMLRVQSGAEVGICVQDEGSGVPEHTLKQLGEPFFRLQPGTEGLGLGLALVRHVAAMLGGRLEFCNRESGGLEAKLLLPGGVSHVA